MFLESCSLLSDAIDTAATPCTQICATAHHQNAADRQTPSTQGFPRAPTNYQTTNNLQFHSRSGVGAGTSSACALSLAGANFCNTLIVWPNTHRTGSPIVALQNLHGVVALGWPTNTSTLQHQQLTLNRHTDLLECLVNQKPCWAMFAEAWAVPISAIKTQPGTHCAGTLAVHSSYSKQPQVPLWQPARPVSEFPKLQLLVCP